MSSENTTPEAVDGDSGVADNATADTSAATTSGSNMSESNALGITSADLINDPSIKDFKTVDDLAKSYVHAKSMLGRSVRIPYEDASKDAYDEFYQKLADVPGVVRMDGDNVEEVYNKLGRPESPDKYQVDFKMEVNPAVQSKAFEIGHKLGLNSKQMQGWADFQSDLVAAEQEQTEKTVGEFQTRIKQEFGAEFDNRLHAAKEAVRIYGEKYPELAQALKNPLVGNNPGLVSIFAELGKNLIEGKVTGGESTVKYGMTPSEALDRIDAIRSDKSHAFNDRKHPGHARAVEKMERMYKIAYGQEDNQ